MCIEGVAVKAPAKINLFLEVLGKRPDGYHEVRSIVVPVALFDDLTFESMDAGVETKVRGSGVQPADVKRLENSTGNLATDAGLVLKEATGYPGGVRIRIEKGIPICGGLGGGSSDAAATLKGLNEMWRTGLGLRELSLLGQRLGSDIPAMLQGRAVVVRGRGERVTALRLNREKRRSDDWWVVIVNPGFGASTKDIYSRHKSALTSPAGVFRNMVCALVSGDIELAARCLFNSLEKTVFAKYPLLPMIAEELRKAGAIGVLLSGSGSSLFGLARDESHARGIGQGVTRAMGDWLWTRAARVLPDGVKVAHSPLEARV